ncbi:Sodium- and chloride-dependent creatine transporter 1 [Mactra antiquata]
MATTEGQLSEIEKFDVDDGSKDDSEEITEKRQTWSSQIDFIMTSVGCAVGLGNIWRFPYLCYKNGGGAFLIPYLITFFLVAAPTYIVEISLGQYTSAGTVRAWSIAPLFQGLGFSSQMILIYSNVYYIVVVAWALYYIAQSFTSTLPWTSCDNPWNTDRCFTTGMTYNYTLGIVNCTNSSTETHSSNCTSYSIMSEKPVDAVEEFWERKALSMSRGIDEPGSLVPGLTVSLLVAWILVYICICRGVKWTGKIVYFTAIVPYLLLTIIFIRGITLDGAVDGLVYYLKPNFSRLTDAQVWLDGATQVLYSIGVGQGFMISLGSYNKFNHNAVRNGFIVICINCLTSVFGGLAVFATLGFMSHEMNLPIEKVASSGPGLVFLTYPKAVSQMPIAPLWSVLFFLTILFVGLDSQFASVESFLTQFVDRWPKILYNNCNRMLFVGLYCVVCFLAGLSLVTEGGVYLFRLIDFYAVSGPVLLTMVFVEVMTIGWVFGMDRFYDALEIMMGYRPGPWIKICVKYTSPVIINVIFWFQVITYQPLDFDGSYVYPTWATVVGFMMSFSSIGCILIVAIYKLMKSKGSFRERLSMSVRPILKKHQIDPRWMNSNYKWTLQQYEAHDVNNPFNINDELEEMSYNESS